jgi:hypothetical protein
MKSLVDSTCAASIPKVCQKQFENPPFSCAADIYNSPLTVLSLASSNTMAFYGLFSFAAVYLIKSWGNKWLASNQDVALVNPQTEFRDLLVATLMCVICCRVWPQGRKDDEEEAAMGESEWEEQERGQSASRSWKELTQRRRRASDARMEAVEVESVASSVDSEWWHDYPHPHPSSSGLQGMQQQQQREEVSSETRTTGQKLQQQQQQQRSCANPADMGSLLSWIGLLEPSGDDGSKTAALVDMVAHMQRQLKAMRSENETTSARLLLLEQERACR